MKKLIVLVLILLVGVCYAEDKKPEEKKDFRLTVESGYSFFNSNKDTSLEMGHNLKAKLAYKGVYLFGSYDDTSMRAYGQQAGRFSFYGLGLGVQQYLGKYVSAFVDIGMYSPTSELADNPAKFTWSDPGHEICEPLYYRAQDLILNKWFRPDWIGVFDYKQSYKVGMGWGANLGIGLDVPLYKNLSVQATGAYRFVSFPERFKTFAKPGTAYEGMYLESKSDLNANGPVVNIGLNFKF